MKKLVIAFGFWLLAFSSFSQSEKATIYINTYKEAAINEMLRSGVPASITLAQGMLESGYGESVLCKKSNNHFGIKCKENWTGATVSHDDDLKGECFRAYPSAADSYKDHSDFLKSRPWYAFLFQLDPTDYEGWAKGLKKAGYATEKDYSKRLIDIITNYNLQQFTLVAIYRKKNQGTDTAATADTASTTSTTAATDTVAKHEEEKEEPVDTTSETVINPVKQAVDTTNKKGNKYAEGIVMFINHTKATFVKEGTSMLWLANNYGITLSKLVEFNDMKEMDVLDRDRLMFMEKKMKKGATDFHIAEENETLYDISQTEGVQLESILAYNKLKKESKLAKGQKIYLRPPVTEKPAATKPKKQTT